MAYGMADRTGTASVSDHEPEHLVADIEKRRGYECEFEAAPQGTQTECPVCLLVLRKPYQVSCCRQRFCQPCIEQICAEENPCPLCRGASFSISFDEELHQTLSALPVQCSRCRWVGDLDQYDKHLHTLQQPTQEAHRIDVFEHETVMLREEVAHLRAEQQRLSDVVQRHEERLNLSADFVMTNFENRCATADAWYSPPFYTHPHQYKMCLKVYASGTSMGKGAHVSVFVHLMRGEFDDYLKWPFRHDITIQLLNQLGEGEHHIKVISFTERTPNDSAGRVIAGDRGESGWGIPRFVSHSMLREPPKTTPRYLMNDCLCFRVSQAVATRTDHVRNIGLDQELEFMRRRVDIIAEESHQLKEELGHVKQLLKQKLEASELQPYGSPMLEYIDREGKNIDWSDMGIILSVPPNATPTSSSPVRVHIQCFLTGPGSVILPVNTELVSPVYKVTISFDFTKQAKLSVAHFAALQSEADCSDMVFLHSTDRSPPYHFYPVPGGKFLSHGALGTIEVKVFSKWAVGKRKQTAVDRGESASLALKQPKETRLKYAVHLYRPLKQHSYAVFCASLCQPLYSQNIQEELAVLFPDIQFWRTFRPVELTSDALELIIPTHCVREQGYSISTDQDCQIFREILDLPLHQPECGAGLYPPRLLLTVRALDDSKPPTTDLMCDLEVRGTVRPCCLKLEMKHPSLETTTQGTHTPGKSTEMSTVHSKGKPTLRELSSHVIVKVAKRWHSLGIQLGLPSELLDATEKNYSRDSQRCCEEIFKEWLVRPELDPSWRMLIEALESEAVSQKNVSYKLRKLYSNQCV